MLRGGDRLLLIDTATPRERGAEVERLISMLAEHGVSVERRVVAGRGQVIAASRGDTGRYRLCLVAGGDGAVNAAVQALAGGRLPLTVLALGTANDFARTLGMPSDAESAFDVLLGGRLRAVDLGRVDGRYFLNVAHVGWGAAAQRELSTTEKARFGVFSYPLGALRALARRRPFRVQLYCDEQFVQLRTQHVSVANGRYFGGGVAVEPDARIDDGRLDVVSLRHRSLARVLWLALLGLLGWRPGHRDVVRLRGSAARVWTRRRRAIVADGEQLGHTPAAFEVIPGALQVLAPDASSNRGKGHPNAA